MFEYIILTPDDFLKLLLTSFGVSVLAYIVYRIVNFLPRFIKSIVKGVDNPKI